MKSCSLAGLALQPDPSAVRLDGRFCNRHSETRSMLFPKRHKRLKNSVSDQWRNARPIIGDRNVQFRSSVMKFDRNRSFLPKGFLRVLDNIRQTTSQTRLIQGKLTGFFDSENEFY